MTECDDLDVLAGEYVLGTLEAVERTAVSARRQREVPLDAAIEAWEQRLWPLIETMPAIRPPAGLKARIEASRLRMYAIEEILGEVLVTVPD